MDKPLLPPAAPARSPSFHVAGRVVRYVKGKHFGFIEPEDGEPVFFHLSDCDPDYQHVHVGDEVAFEADEHDGRPCARRVRYLGNATLDGLRTDFEQGTVLQGYIVRIEGIYYVKDVETHLFIQLVLSLNEMDTDETYEGSLNQIRGYQLVRMSAHNALSAVLVGRRFKPGLAELASGQSYAAEVLYGTKGGYLLQLVDHDIKGLLPCKEVFKQAAPLASGRRVNVQLRRPLAADQRLLFELANDSKEKFLSPAELSAWRAAQLAAIGPGYAATATVKRVLNFGAFVSFDSVDALLHIKLFTVPDSPDGTRAEKQALGDLLAELLPPKTEVAVVVNDVDGPRCSVDLDMSVASNVALKAEFTRREQLLPRA